MKEGNTLNQFEFEFQGAERLKLTTDLHELETKFQKNGFSFLQLPEQFE